MQKSLQEYKKNEIVEQQKSTANVINKELKNHGFIGYEELYSDSDLPVTRFSSVRNYDKGIQKSNYAVSAIIYNSAITLADYIKSQSKKYTRGKVEINILPRMNEYGFNKKPREIEAKILNNGLKEKILKIEYDYMSPNSKKLKEFVSEVVSEMEVSG